MVRIGVSRDSGGPVTCNDPKVIFKGNCIADQCAMWREIIQLHACDQPPPAPRGYCGLAGRP